MQFDHISGLRCGLQAPLVRRGKRGWWILGYECGPMGPYKTKAEAQDDARGVKRFYSSIRVRTGADARKGTPNEEEE